MKRNDEHEARLSPGDWQAITRAIATAVQHHRALASVSAGTERDAHQAAAGHLEKIQQQLKKAEIFPFFGTVVVNWRKDESWQLEIRHDQEEHL